MSHTIEIGGRRCGRQFRHVKALYELLIAETPVVLATNNIEAFKTRFKLLTGRTLETEVSGKDLYTVKLV